MLVGPAAVTLITVVMLTILAVNRVWGASEAIYKVFFLYVIFQFGVHEAIFGAIQWVIGVIPV